MLKDEFCTREGWLGVILRGRYQRWGTFTLLPLSSIEIELLITCKAFSNCWAYSLINHCE